MARKQSTAEILMALERSGAMKSMDPSGRMGLLSAKLGGGLLSRVGQADERQNGALVQAAVDTLPNIGGGENSSLKAGLLGGAAFQPVTSGMASMSSPVAANDGAGLTAPAQPTFRRRGLLSQPDQGPRGLLSGALPPSQPATQQPRPQQPPARRQGFDFGAFADDFLFGGAASERASERRQRGEAEAMQAAHRDAFAYATQGGQGFNPTAYETRMAELGQAPDYQALAGLEGITDSQDVRGLRGRTERRGVQAGAVAPLYGMAPDQFGEAAPRVEQYLQGEGFGLDGPLTPQSVLPMMGAGMGADSYFDNQRGDRALSESIRSNMAGEAQNAAQLAYQDRRDALEREYRANRDMTEDDFRRQDMALRRELGLIPNSTGDIIAPILSKVATGGVGSLNDGERAIWENYQRQSQGQGGLAALFGGGPGPAGVGGAPTPAPQAVAGSSQQAPARVASQAEFDRLPAGAWFINPRDGQVMQKAR